MAAAKINVLERFKDVLAAIRNGSIDLTGARVLHTLGMVERHIESLEKNHGFGAQKRADIAAQLMAATYCGPDPARTAKEAVIAADALLYELNGGKAELAQVWTHVEKGGMYEVLGEAIGAGTNRNKPVVVYRCLSTGKMYNRAPHDFLVQMKKKED